MDYPADANLLPSLGLRNIQSLDIRSILSLSHDREMLPTMTRIYGIAGERFAFGDALSTSVSGAMADIEQRIANDILTHSTLGRFNAGRTEPVADSVLA